MIRFPDIIEDSLGSYGSAKESYPSVSRSQLRQCFLNRVERLMPIVSKSYMSSIDTTKFLLSSDKKAIRLLNFVRIKIHAKV